MWCIFVLNFNERLYWGDILFVLRSGFAHTGTKIAWDSQNWYDPVAEYLYDYTINSSLFQKIQQICDEVGYSSVYDFFSLYGLLAKALFKKIKHGL